MTNGLPFNGEGTALRGYGPRLGKAPEIRKDDPAFQPPKEQLTEQTRAKAQLVYRDIPLVTVQNTWTVQGARQALWQHMWGWFDQSAQLFDSILGDDRVMATLGSRISGLFGREVRFRPADDSMAAKECLDAWVNQAWPRFSAGSALIEQHTYGIGLGFGPGQLVWDTSKPVWCPYSRPWHPRFTYFDWPLRKFVALTQDGLMPMVAGDGKWIVHAPFGEYRGWIRGAIRALTEPWMLRHFAFRDMARFSEVHGQPIRKGYVPAVGDAGERAQFQEQLASLGAETTIMLPRDVDMADGNGYDVELLEAKDRAWEVFGGLIDRCDMAIVLALLYQNLTTEVTGGSFAAANVHADIRQSALQADDAAWKETIYYQVARPFAWLNFGDPDLAPWTFRDVEPREDLENNAKMFQAFGTALEVLARGGVKFTDSEEVRRFAARKFGLDSLPDFTISDPVSSTGGGMGGFGK